MGQQFKTPNWVIWAIAALVIIAIGLGLYIRHLSNKTEALEAKEDLERIKDSTEASESRIKIMLDHDRQASQNDEQRLRIILDPPKVQRQPAPSGKDKEVEFINQE